MPEAGHVAKFIRHTGTRVLPVFVLSLAEAPSGEALGKQAGRQTASQLHILWGGGCGTWFTHMTGGGLMRMLHHA